MSCIFGVLELSVNANINNLDTIFHSMKKSLGNFEKGVENYLEEQIGANYYLGAYHLEQGTKPTGLSNKSTEDLIFWSDAKILNRSKLGDLLSIHRTELKSYSDSNLLFLAYKKWDKEFTKYINGCYTVVVYSKKKNEIDVFSDPLGMRSFYYIFLNEKFYFSTFLHGLTSIDSIPCSLNEDFCHQLLCSMSSVYKEKSCFNEISRLPNSSILNIKSQSKKISKYQYFDISSKPLQLKSYEEYLQIFRDELEHAVLCRIPKNISNIGSQYSGGLDSTSIAAIAQPHCLKNNIDLYAFPNVLPDDLVDETLDNLFDNKVLIEQTLKELDIQHVYPIGKVHSDFIQQNQDLINRYNRPDISYFDGTLKSIKEASANNKFKYLFSGFGGDQCVTFHSIRFPKHLVQNRQYIQLARQWKIIPWRKMLNYIIQDNLLLSKTYVWVRQIRTSNKGIKTISIIDNNIFSGNEKIRITTKKIKAVQKKANSLNEEMLQRLNNPAVSRRLEQEAMLAHYRGLEMLYPLLDLKLIQLFFSIPNDKKILKYQHRLFFKNAISKWIKSPAFLQQKKSNPNGSNHPTFVFNVLKQRESINKVFQDFERENTISFINFDNLYQVINGETRALAVYYSGRVLRLLQFWKKMQKK